MWLPVLAEVILLALTPGAICLWLIALWLSRRDA